MKKNTGIISFLLLFASQLLQAQTPGSLDSSFGINGKVLTPIPTRVGNVYISSHAIQPDGRIIILANLYDGVTETDSFLLCRYNPNGATDAGFGTNGVLRINFSGIYALLQPDGKILIAGTIEDEIVLTRFLSNGTADASFGMQGMAYTGIFCPISSAQLQPDGKILITGSALGNTVMVVARLNPDGYRDFGFGEDGIALVDFGKDNYYEQTMNSAIQPDGKIVVLGNVQKNNGGYTALLRLNANGSIDSTFSSDGRQTGAFPTFYANQIIILYDGKILLAGNYYYNSYNNMGFFVSRYKPDGSVDNTFGSNGMRSANYGATWDMINDITLQVDGKILVAGASTNTSSGTVNLAMARFTSTGSLDTAFSGDGKLTTSFGAGTQSRASFIHILPDAKILAGGAVNINDSNSAFCLAQYISGLKASVAEIGEVAEMRVFPNPFNEQLTIDYTLARNETINISLSDVYGKQINHLVYNEARKAGRQTETLQLQNMDIPAGLYFLTISNGSANKCVKLLKQ